jgi:type VI secretion system protein ImpI
MLGIVVDGVMDVLRARAEIKNTFRLPVTIIQRSENNPLKFAPNADEALQKILSPPNAAFLSGPAAFDDAFDDIRCHQMAMLAGVRAAFESLLAHFGPDRLEQEVDGGKRSAFGGKAKYWEKYRENFEALIKNPDDCFRRLFGDEFARAYEEQLARLKSARRNSARR